jgi:uncharacterized protein (TIGR00369 family)
VRTLPAVALLATSARVVDATLDARLRRGLRLRFLSRHERVNVNTPRDPLFESRVRDSFARQSFMKTIGARLIRVMPGEVDIELDVRPDLGQQHGFLHAGVVTSAADSACGYAALSLMEPGTGVLSIEFKINLLAPAAGDRIVARGSVIRAGRTITVCSADVMAVSAGGERLVATMVATMMTQRDRGLTD